MGLTFLDVWKCFTTVCGGQYVTMDLGLLRPAWCVACSTTPKLSALYLMQGLAKEEVCCVGDYYPCCPPALASNTSLQYFYLLSSFGRTYPLSFSSSVSSRSLLFTPIFSSISFLYSLSLLPDLPFSLPSSLCPLISPSYSFYPQGQIWLDDVDCTVGHEVLEECNHRGWGVHNCQHSSDVGVVCSPSESRDFPPYQYCNRLWRLIVFPCIDLGNVKNLRVTAVSSSSVTLQWDVS